MNESPYPSATTVFASGGGGLERGLKLGRRKGPSRRRRSGKRRGRRIDAGR